MDIGVVSSDVVSADQSVQFFLLSAITDPTKASASYFAAEPLKVDSHYLAFLMTTLPFRVSNSASSPSFSPSISMISGGIVNL